MKIKENIYFTEITEDEKRIINLIRTYVKPLESTGAFIDNLVENIAHKLVDKTVRLKAFTSAFAQERNNNEMSDMEIMARINQFEEYICSDNQIMQGYMKHILSDIVKTMEGDIKPVQTYTTKEQLEEEEKILDKIQESC